MSKLVHLALLFSSGVFTIFARSQILNGPSAMKKAYTPVGGSCPDGFQLVRTAGTGNSQALGSGETAYIASRDSHVLPGAWSSYSTNVLNKAYSQPVPDYVSNILTGEGSYPRLGISTSGGGHRAAIFGAGVLNALDGRNITSSNAGTGGLLQASSYLVGLSGGSWLVTSAVQANLPPLYEVVFGSQSSQGPDWGGWITQIDLVAPTIDPVTLAAFYGSIIDEIGGKRDAGFPLTINDFWARLLARHFVNGTFASSFFDNTDTTHGAGLLFSDVTNVSNFANFEIPFPIVVSNSVSNRENRSTITNSEDLVPLTNVIYEFNPYEMGSFDPMLSSFAPTKYLGTTNSTVCITNYDQAAFVTGTSSELFNEFNTTITNILDSEVGPILDLITSAFPQPEIELDVALYPNSFLGVNPDAYPDFDQEYLSLVDGGEDGEVIPIQPLLVQAREVDVIFAIDATSDENNYAAGSSLIASWNRTTLFPSTYAFPQVPNTTEQFVAQQLNSRPTFFGCDDSSPVPLVIYLANGGPPPGQTPLTNTSTTQTQYPIDEVQAMLDQTFTIATQGRPVNDTQAIDSDWPACLACAIVDRKRGHVERSGICSDCFSRYCWSS